MTRRPLQAVPAALAGRHLSWLVGPVLYKSKAKIVFAILFIAFFFLSFLQLNQNFYTYADKLTARVPAACRVCTMRDSDSISSIGEMVPYKQILRSRGN